MTTPTTAETGAAINRRLLALGIFTLVDLAGDKIWFYPRGTCPAYVIAYLKADDGRRARLLRNHCVNLGRGLA